MLSSLKGLFLEEPGISSFLHYASEEETKRAPIESSPQWDCCRISRSPSATRLRLTSSAAAACKRLPFVIEILPHLRDYWKTGMDFRIHRSVHFKERVITCRRHHPGGSRRLSLKSAQGEKHSHNNHAAIASSSCFCWAGGQVMGVAGHSGRSIVIGRRRNHLDDMVG